MRKFGRILAWLGWIAVWCFGIKFLALAGEIEERKILWIAIEAILCCVAACIMSQSKLITVVTLLIMTVKFVTDISIVSVFWYLMGIGLWIVTIMTPSILNTQTPRKQATKQAAKPQQATPDPTTQRVKLK